MYADRMVGRASAVFGVGAGIIVVGLMLLTVADVLLRNLFNTPLPWTIPYSEVAIVLIVFLGLGYAEWKNAHISVELLTSRLPEKPQRVLSIVVLVCCTLFLGWAVLATVEAGMVSTQAGETRTGLVTVPVWPARLLIPVGLALMALQRIVRELAALAENSGSSVAADATSKAG